jgi:3-oxoacyl-[acyl-carrier-protein] synthase II
VSAERETWITGIGLLSSLGEGTETHKTRLFAGDVPVANTEQFPPFVLHPLGAVSFDKQIPKKSDQRQMEQWQRIGTYTAGLALTDAGVAGNEEILSRMDMIVAAGGGERDPAVDAGLMTDLRKSNKPEQLINDRLQTELRPTLFLGQLSNLLAGNISIVHGVTGSSRTFLGEEGAGIEALRIARARINAGTSDIALVGGAYNAERPDMLLLFEFGGLNLKGEFAPVFSPKRPAGMAAGSMGAFMVLESREHAESRGAKPIAKLGSIYSGRGRRDVGEVESSLSSLLAETIKKVEADATAIFSGATGCEPSTAEEAKVLADAKLPVRSIASRVGHGFEAAFPIGVALAAIAVKEGKLFPSMPNVPLEASSAGQLKSAIVTCVGHWRGEGVGVVEAIS